MDLVRILRILIAAEALCSVVSIAAGMVLEKDLPLALQEFVAEQKSGSSNLAISLVAMASLLAIVVAWIGLWRLKAWSRMLYTIGSAVGLLAVPFYGATVWDGTAAMFYMLSVTASGATLALIWLSPVADHFRIGSR
jgi:hypothetical protein